MDEIKMQEESGVEAGEATPEQAPEQEVPSTEGAPEEPASPEVPQG